MSATSQSSQKKNYIIRNLSQAIDLIRSDRITKVSILYLSLLVLLAIVGPTVAPYEANETIYRDGSIAMGESPSIDHPLGTTDKGYDVLSRLIIGVRPTVLTGLLGGLLILVLGTSVGITAGYMGGQTDNALMRITDFVYGIPFIPFAIVLVTLLGVGFYTSILVIGLILWRGSARVLRSQVLQIKERPFIRSAKATGASKRRIVFKHIIPNVAPMAVLFFALGVGYSIILQASLAFLGVSNPFVPSWGVMLRNAYLSGSMATTWWWSLPPGALISLTVLATFMFGRAYESNSTGKNGTAFAEGGG
ncbi:ABC transporter permease [Halorussus salinisoli]|uniref:ABC transporter permease n=1 Tax=Halorussus salinisoli TaxID=2558242 RepID=UPI0010C20471|nr:ABC transporter permease [Halorussus salinisoli]